MTTRNSRTLKFICSDLGRVLHLYLTFVPPKVSGDIHPTPVTWRILQFQTAGQGLALVKCTGYTAFVVPAGEDGNKIFASNSQLCAAGQRCTLISSEGTNTITKAIPGDPGLVRCTNNASSMADIGFGLTEQDGTDVELIHFWKNVPVSSMVKFEFSPVLQIYYTTDFLSNSESSTPLPDPLWKMNLNSLGAQTTLLVSIDPTTEVPTITTIRQQLLPGDLYTTTFNFDTEWEAIGHRAEAISDSN